MKKVSIQDIAKELNLSRNTVSKALSNSDTVAFETKQKIVGKALEMGYEKLDPVFQREIEGTGTVGTRNIAVLAHMEIADFWNRIIRGISEELSKNGLNLLFNFVNKEDENKLVFPPNIANKDVDGIIVLSVFKREYIQSLVETHIPVVFLDSPIGSLDSELNADVLLVEGEDSVYEITSELIKSGRKKIGFIGDINYCRTIYDRFAGFSRAFKEAGYTLDEDICFTSNPKYRFYDEQELYNILVQIKSTPDAFICANDDIAINVIRFFKQKGYKVPEDIAVTGFDDKRDSVVIEPPLTSVHVYNEQIGKRLVQELRWRIENPDMPFEQIVVKTKVIYRKSSGL